MIGFNRNFPYGSVGDREDLMDNVRKTVPIIFGILILTGISGFQFAPMTVQTAEAAHSKK